MRAVLPNSSSKGDETIPEEAIIVCDQLNTEERKILEKFERDELRPAAGADREMQIAPRAARSTFNKTRRVNLGNGTRLFPSTRESARRGHPLSDAVVERHPQVPWRRDGS